MVKIFVSGFPLDMNELELVKIVSMYGAVETIKIVRDKKTRICKGYAFLEMVDDIAAKKVIEGLDGTPISNRFFTVRMAAA